MTDLCGTRALGINDAPVTLLKTDVTFLQVR